MDRYFHHHLHYWIFTSAGVTQILITWGAQAPPTQEAVWNVEIEPLMGRRSFRVRGYLSSDLCNLRKSVDESLVPDSDTTHPQISQMDAFEGGALLSQMVCCLFRYRRGLTRSFCASDLSFLGNSIQHLGTEVSVLIIR